MLSPIECIFFKVDSTEADLEIVGKKVIKSSSPPPLKLCNKKDPCGDSPRISKYWAQRYRSVLQKICSLRNMKQNSLNHVKLTT